MVALAGCSAPAPKPKPPAEDKGPGLTAVPVLAPGVTLTARDNKGKVTWVLHAKESKVTVGGKGSQAEVQGITGEIYDGGVVSSRFSADAGEADQTTHFLSVHGHVSITSEPANGRKGSAVTLTADRAKWLDDRQLVAAQGSVWVRSDVYETGEYRELWANKDLTRVGTPDRFQR
ncbi:MAG: LPS export ABC transporter periplasmic protein LptC [Armatimonadetes bacterium]|nr:LPS export ABC transporter periplasmic protein LptC [Armatimonadota bacterium]